MRPPFLNSHYWRFFFRPSYYAISIPIVLSLVGTLLFASLNASTLNNIFANRWGLAYLLGSTFFHGGLFHFAMNSMALHFIGGQMLLPVIRTKLFTALLITSAIAALLVNNLISDSPAVGISGAIMGVVACAVYPFARMPMRLLLIHDLIPNLRPFQYRYIAFALPVIDICGILFGWQFFAHHAHLAGFCTGAAFGYVLFGLGKK